MLARKARAAWDGAVDVWEDFQEAGKDYSRDEVHGPALLKAIGPLRGRRVLDLGCGQGRFTRELARGGASVLGVDWSRRMIDAAVRHERADPVGLEFRREDARTVGRSRPPGSFDLVVSCMAFMDMPALPRVLGRVRALLRPEGRLVFSISHPMNSAAVRWERPGGADPGAMLVDRYFDERPGRLHWRMARLTRPFRTVYWHRTLESWFGLLNRAGFEVEGLWEPRATPRQVRELPLLRGASKFPFYLVLRCRRRPSPRR